MNRLRIIIFTLIYLEARSQDPVLSQFYSAPLLLNPAFAGNTVAPRFALNYRNQWPLLQQAYRTYALSYDQFFESTNSGLGVVLLADDAGKGLYKTTKLAGIYAYRLKISKNTYIKTGMELAGVQAHVNWDKLIFPDQLDPLYGEIGPGGSPIPSAEIRPDRTNRLYLDLSMGTMLYNPYFYGGITLHHVNNPDIRFIRISDNTSSGLPVRFTIHGGSQISIFDSRSSNKDIFVSPNILYTRQGNFSELLGGAYLGMGPLFAGLWMRLTPNNPDAGIVNVGLRKGNMKISYSFDTTISKLTLGSGGAHELGIVFNLDDQSPRKSPDYNDCFQLFR